VRHGQDFRFVVDIAWDNEEALAERAGSLLMIWMQEFPIINQKERTKALSRRSHGNGTHSLNVRNVSLKRSPELLPRLLDICRWL
jgi:site-specific recombinase